MGIGKTQRRAVPGRRRLPLCRSAWSRQGRSTLVSSGDLAPPTLEYHAIVCRSLSSIRSYRHGGGLLFPRLSPAVPHDHHVNARKKKTKKRGAASLHPRRHGWWAFLFLFFPHLQHSFTVHDVVQWAWALPLQCHHKETFSCLLASESGMST